jgi:short-subunit dehydrogenase
MTEGMDLPAALTTTPDHVAKAVVDAVEKKRNVIYVKFVWRLIMTVIRNIPENIFKFKEF